MTTCVIEVNDYELRLATRGEVLASSPGQATLVDGRVEIGSAAMAVAWTHPRTSENRYWRDLNTAAIEHLGPRVRHHADLAWMQLEQLKSRGGNPAQVQFAVPGSMHTEQLSLLLGLADATQLRTTALVDSAVAAGAGALGPGHWAHVDLQQHQAVITRLDVNEQVSRGLVEVLPELGLNRLREACIRVITQCFVSHCRFDPRHHADTEQILQSQLDQWLGMLRQHHEIKLQLDYRGRRFDTRLTRSAIQDALIPLLNPLREALPAGATPVASHRLAAQPGFSACFPGVAVLPEKAVFIGMASLASASGTAQSLVVQLPAARTPSVQVVIPATAPVSDAPTHILDHDTARAIDHKPVYLLSRGGFARSAEAGGFCGVTRSAQGLELQPMADARVRVNGQAVNRPQRLVAGDQITLQGASVLYTAIRVQGPDAD